jgi:predicted phosphohydrolase
MMIACPRRWMATLTLCILAVAIPRAALPQQGPQSAAQTGQPARAGHIPEIHVHWARTILKDDVYYLDAAIEYHFGQSLEEALLKGVAVPIIVDIEVIHERDYLWNETTASLAQRYVLEYHALTQQYIVRNVNISAQSAFPSLAAALASLGQIVALPVIDANLLTRGERYLGRLRSSVDIDALPVPLRLLAIISPEWRLSSEWYEWRF